jgi:hypothetical protein
VSLLASCLPYCALCQQAEPAPVPAKAARIDFSNTRAFPRVFAPYYAPFVPAAQLDNSRRLEDLIVDGKLTLTLDDAIALTLENNLHIAVARYDLPIAQTDLLRAKAGGATRGVAGSPQSTTLFAGSLGGGAWEVAQGSETWAREVSSGVPLMPWAHPAAAIQTSLSPTVGATPLLP